MEIVEVENKKDGTDTEYYNKAADYWAAVPTTIDGMLGGFAKISHTDIDGSNKLLKLLMKVCRWPVGNWDRIHSVKQGGHCNDCIDE